MTHTPTPWFTTGSLIGKTTDSGGYEIGYVSELAVGPDEAEANAEFIARAVNAHDAMLAALRDAFDWADRHGKNPDWMEDARSAIALSDGKP